MSGTPTKSKNTSREPKAPPYVDCIQWVPRRFAGGPSPVTLADLVFTQHALKAVRDHAGSQQTAAVFGLLIGRIHEDPTCARPWVNVEHVLRGTTLPANHTLLQLDHAYEALLGGVDETHGIVVGWYCSHPGAGLYLSPDEARFHESRFSSPWEMALVVVGDAGRFTGGVFQRTNPEGLSRSIYTPFYELVDGSSEFNGNTKRTFVGWPNYQTETRVVMAGRGSVSAHIPLAGGDPYAESVASEAEAGVPAADRGAELPFLASAPEPPDAPAAAPRPAKKRTPAPSGDAKRPAASTIPPKKDNRPSREPATGTAPKALPRTPSGRPAAGKGLDSVPIARSTGSGDIEADWEKKQIQRSLMAVGRSIGPSAMGDLARPVEVGADDDDGIDARQQKASRPKRETPEPRDPVEEPRRQTPAPPIRRPSPVSPASTLSSDPGMVGRSRRKGGLPMGKILAAAAGLVLLAGAVWVGAQALRGPSGAVAQEEATAGRTTAEAGVSLAPRDLFSEDRNATSDTAVEGPDALEASSEQLVALGPDGAADPAATDDGLTARDDAQATTARTEEPQPETRTPAPRQQTPAEQNPPPAPNEIQLDLEDPDVSAYENALQIFRSEADRYDTERQAFDDGGGSCNALNLALRGVRESFGRLERRYNTAAEKFAGPQLRAFEGAGRQNAMISTHYSLTDCPASGG